MKTLIIHILLISLFVIGCARSDGSMKEGHDKKMKSDDEMMMESDDEMMKSEDTMMMESDDDKMMMESEDDMMKSEDTMMKSEDTMMMESEELAKATFAGGCFWCMEPPYDKLDGVISTTSGYIGGQKENPTYKEVSAGVTGHAEAVQVVYDPTKVSYAELLDVFWKNIDPTVEDRQFCDHGDQYRTAIFYHNDYGWMGHAVPILSVLIFLLLNSNRCKSIMSS